MTDGKKKKESSTKQPAEAAIPSSPSQGDPTSSTGKCASDASNGGPTESKKDHDNAPESQNKDKNNSGGGDKERTNGGPSSTAAATKPSTEVNGISTKLSSEVKNSPPVTPKQANGGGHKKGKNGKEEKGKAKNGKEEEDINANEGTGTMEFEFAIKMDAIKKKSEKAAMEAIKKASEMKIDKYTLGAGGIVLAVMAGFAIRAFVPNAVHTEVNDPHYISILNSQNLGWKAGAIPAFDGLTVEDIRNLGSVTANSNSQCPSVEIDGPTHFDAREKWPNCFNHEVLTQRNCSSSWAIQIASTMGNRFCIGADEPEDYKKYLLSAQELLSCSMDNAGCQGGDMDAAFEYVMENGLVKEACFPFQGTDTVGCSKKCKKKKKALRASGVCVVDTVTNLKTELMLNGPLIVPMFIFNDVLLYKEGIYTPYANANLLPLPGRKNQFLMHAVKLLGWGEENNVEYWLIENSFGPEWGTNGVGKIKRVSEVSSNPVQAARQQVVVEFGMSITPRRLYFDEDEE